MIKANKKTVRKTYARGYLANRSSVLDAASRYPRKAARGVSSGDGKGVKISLRLDRRIHEYLENCSNKSQVVNGLLLMMIDGKVKLDGE